MKNNLSLELLCGIPASGKTTLSAFLVQSKNLVKICPDDIRLEICGDMKDQSQNKRVFEIAFERCKSALSQGNSVLIDATNVTRKSRKGWCDLGKSFNAQITVYVLSTSFDECKRRNQARSERVVPDFVIDRMIASYEAPDKNLERIDFIKKV